MKMKFHKILAGGLSVLLLMAAPALYAGGQNPCAAKAAANPCAAKMNPCAAKMNPCAAKGMNPCNPCAAKNPCAGGGGPMIDASKFMRPAGFKKLHAGTHAALVKQGEQLWKDTKLGSSGLACQSCHMDNQGFNPTFAKAYPHKVAMPAQMAGVGKITLDEMVQFCMLAPMKSKPLPWHSEQLAALTAYAAEVQKGYKAHTPAKVNQANPCAAKNPCAGK